MKSVKYDNIPLNTPLKAHAKSVGAVLYYKNTEQKVGNGWTWKKTYLTQKNINENKPDESFLIEKLIS